MASLTGASPTAQPAPARAARPVGAGAPTAVRMNRRERFGAWLECLLGFGEALDVSEVHPLFDDADPGAAKPASSAATARRPRA